MVSDPLADSSGFQSTAVEAASENLIPNPDSDRGHNGELPGAGSALAPSLGFGIPREDQLLHSRLPDDVRAGLWRILTILSIIHDSPNKSAAIRHQAKLYQGTRGLSEESIDRKYYAYIASGDWRCLIDRAKAGPAFWNIDSAIGLPKAFLEFWKSLCERNQRKTAPARRELLRIWKTGHGTDPATGKPKHYKTFPGYPSWQPGLSPQPSVLSPDSFPPGWSPANLNRHAPSKFELAVARHGREAASAYRRKVFTTRVGLHVGQFYLFDDLQYDLLVNFPGNRYATPPLGLIALDLLSACAIGIGFKPTVVDLEGTKRKLKERDMLWLVVDVLCNKGYRTDKFGTHLVVENGTAAIRPDFQQRILAATAEKVQVDRAGLSSMHLPGLFEGQSKGNPRFKAALESLINLIHNEQGMLPAQTGLDYKHAPTQLAGLKDYNTKLLKLAEQLPAHRRDLLRFPVMTFDQFKEVTLDIFQRINERTDHELQGWKDFVEQEFFLQLPPSPPAGEGRGEGVLARFTSQQWLSLPAHQRQALKPMVNATARQLSPQEVWNRSAGELQKLPEHAIPVLLGPEFGVERQVKGGYINIEDQELSSEPLRFNAFPHQTGDKFLVYLSPHNSERLILTDAKGRYVGGLDKQFIPSRDDMAGVQRELGRVKAEEAALIAPVTTRALPLIRAQIEMRENNTAVFDGQPVTSEEIQKAADLRARLKKIKPDDVDDFLSPVESSVTLARLPGEGSAQDEKVGIDAPRDPLPENDDDDIESFL